MMNIETKGRHSIHIRHSVHSVYCIHIIYIYTGRVLLNQLLLIIDNI